MVAAKVIKWVEVFIAKPYAEAKDDNFVSESSKCVQNTRERLDPQFTKY